MKLNQRLTPFLPLFKDVPNSIIDSTLEKFWFNITNLCSWESSYFYQMLVFNFFYQKLPIKLFDHAVSEYINRIFGLVSILYIGIIIDLLLFFLFYVLGFLLFLDWQFFYLLLLNNHLVPIIFQLFEGFLVLMFSGLLLVLIFTGLFSLSDASEFCLFVFLFLSSLFKPGISVFYSFFMFRSIF